MGREEEKWNEGGVEYYEREGGGGGEVENTD